MTQDFWFIRHGETDWNKRHAMQGSQDIPLNDRGREQAHEAAQTLVGETMTQIISSPLSRAYETAQIIQSVIDRPLTLQDSLKECNWGDREGQAMGDWFWQWKAGEFTPEGAEDYTAFLHRAHCAILEAIQNNEGPILIVAHGGIYWGIAHYMLKTEGTSMPNAEAHFFQSHGDIWLQGKI